MSQALMWEYIHVLTQETAKENKESITDRMYVSSNSRNSNAHVVNTTEFNIMHDTVELNLECWTGVLHVQ